MSVGLSGLAGGAGYMIDSLPVLLASRALLGIGAAGIYVTATILLTEYFTNERQRETILCWQGAFITSGGVVCLLLGGVLASIGWRMPFLIYLVALPLIPLIAIGLYEPEPEGAEQGDETPDGSVINDRVHSSVSHAAAGAAALDDIAVDGFMSFSPVPAVASDVTVVNVRNQSTDEGGSKTDCKRWEH